MNQVLDFPPLAEALPTSTALAAEAENARQKAAFIAENPPTELKQTLDAYLPPSEPASLRPDGTPKPIITVELNTTPPFEIPPTPPAPTLNLGKLCDRLGFIVSAELLGTLGFPAVAQRSSRLFYEGDFPAICAKLAEHCLRVGESA